jgi:hypothetical protein
MKRPIVVTTLVVVLLVPLGGVRAEGRTPEKFVLSGVLVLEGGRGVAYLQEPTLTGNRVVTVRTGESIGPYRVTKILDDRVELEGPAGTVLIPVSGGSVGGPTAVASTAPGPPSPPASLVPERAPVKPLTPEERAAAVRRFEESSGFGSLFNKLKTGTPGPQSASVPRSGLPVPTDPNTLAIIRGNGGNQDGWRALFGVR